jgi:TetR/AcrR family tetracycline transcriptional repressor
LSRTLTRERILATALELADREGLEALGMRRVARELGVTPMALYRHVENRDDLVDELRESLWERLAPAAPGGQTWQDELKSIARSFRVLVRRHPAAAALMLTSRGDGAQELRVCGAMHDSFLRAGFDAETATMLYRQFSHFVLGLVAQDDGFELGLDVFLSGAHAVRTTAA